MITAVVTGGSGLIGSAIVRALKAQNVELVYAPGRDVMDVRSYTSVVGQLRAYGRIDLLVNCAGGSRPVELIADTPNGWLHELEVNLVSVMNCCHALISLAGRGGMDIINIASWAGVSPHPNLAAYSASKAGVIAFSDALDAELGARESGIRVGCISPSRVSKDNPTTLSPEAVARAVVMMWNTPRCQRLGHMILQERRFAK